MGGACWLVNEKYALREMNFMIYFCFSFLQMTVSPPPPSPVFSNDTPPPHTHTHTSYDRIIIYDSNNRFCRDEYKYNTRTLQCVLEKQERKSVWVYALARDFLFALFFKIFFNWKIPYYKILRPLFLSLFLTLQMWRIFLVASLVT